MIRSVKLADGFVSVCSWLMFVSNGYLGITEGRRAITFRNTGISLSVIPSISVSLFFYF